MRLSSLGPTLHWGLWWNQELTFIDWRLQILFLAKKYLLAEKYLISLALEAIEESSDYLLTVQSIPENYSNDNTKSLRESRPSSKVNFEHYM